MGEKVGNKNFKALNAHFPFAVAANPKTNKIYIANQGSLGPGTNQGNVIQLPPPPLNYTVTVTAASGAIQHTT